MATMVCMTCGSIGEPKKRTRGSFLVELALWCCVFVPGFIYSMWRLSTKERVCRECGSTTLVPPNSPAGRKMLEANAEAVATLAAKSAGS